MDQSVKQSHPRYGQSCKGSTILNYDFAFLCFGYFKSSVFGYVAFPCFCAIFLVPVFVLFSLSLFLGYFAFLCVWAILLFKLLLVKTKSI